MTHQSSLPYDYNSILPSTVLTVYRSQLLNVVAQGTIGYYSPLALCALGDMNHKKMLSCTKTLLWHI